jgi:hypothetical protein
MARGQTREVKTPGALNSVFCTPEQARRCGASNGKKCELARIGDVAVVFQRDGGNVTEMRGSVTAIVSDRECSDRAINAYIPSAARPTYRPTPSKLRPVFRS